MSTGDEQVLQEPARAGSKSDFRSPSRDVRFGSQADIPEGLDDVRYSPESGHRVSALRCPLGANSGS
jgi:hypothetical protein